jgi:ketosteroid isomerase-like protein
MKKIYCLALMAMMIMSACQPKPKTVTVDTAAVKTAITAFMDEFNAAFKGDDASKVIVLLTEDALTLGTDPSEFWDKKQISDAWTQVMADTTIAFEYTVDKREIRLAADGNSAVVVEQFTMPIISQKIPVRNVYHVVKVGDKWMIDFMSFSFIPKNEDIVKLNKALE